MQQCTGATRQRAEDVTDRQAAEAVRTRIDWQYLRGLRLDDPGFDHTALAEFRARVADGGLELVVLDALLARLAAGGLVKAGGKQRTDSTRVVAAVAALNRLELAGEAVRAAVEALAAVHPAWVAQRICVADWTRRYGTPMTSWRPPASEARRDELAIACARDGYALLAAVYDRSAPGWLRELPAVDVLRRVLLQNYTQMTGAIHDDLAGTNLAPGRHYLDSGYLSAAVVAAEHARHGIALIGPLLADTSAQARAGQGYARADFTVDYDSKTVTCPQGKTARSWSPCTQHGKHAIVAIFSTTDCGPCPARSLCTAARRRVLSLPPPDLAHAQAAARAAEKTVPFLADYARRAGVEGTIHQAVSHGARRARYRGLPKTRLDHAYMACALNLLRLEAYWTGTPLDRQRTSHLARLELSLAA